MTKADIKIELMMLKQVCEGHRRRALLETENIHDYEHGQATAYEKVAERLEEIIEKI